MIKQLWWVWSHYCFCSFWLCVLSLGDHNGVGVNWKIITRTCTSTRFKVVELDPIRDKILSWLIATEHFSALMSHKLLVYARLWYLMIYLVCPWYLRSPFSTSIEWYGNIATICDHRIPSTVSLDIGLRWDSKRPKADWNSMAFVTSGSLLIWLHNNGFLPYTADSVK